MKGSGKENDEKENETCHCFFSKCSIRTRLNVKLPFIFFCVFGDKYIIQDGSNASSRQSFCYIVKCILYFKKTFAKQMCILLNKSAFQCKSCYMIWFIRNLLKLNILHLQIQYIILYIFILLESNLFVFHFLFVYCWLSMKSAKKKRKGTRMKCS